MKKETRTSEELKELARYRATGLTPEQVVEMDKLYLEKCRELNETKKKIEEQRNKILEKIKALEESANGKKMDTV